MDLSAPKGEGTAAAGRSIVSLGLPAGVLLALLYRQGRVVVPQDGTTLDVGDRVVLFAEGELYEAARELLLG